MTLTRLAARFRGHGFMGNVALLASSAAAGQAVVLVASPILTRLYSAEDYGALAVYASTVGVLGVAGMLRLEAAVLIPERDEEALHVMLAALAVLLATTLLVIILLAIFGQHYATWTSAPALRTTIWLVAIGYPSLCLYQLLSVWGLRRRAFGAIARTKLTQSVGQVLVQIALGLLKGGPGGLLAGDIVGRAAGSASLAAITIRDVRREGHRISWRDASSALWRYRRFPQLSAGAALVNSLGTELPTLVFAGLYGPRVVGWYALAFRVTCVPLNFVGTAMGQVFVAECARTAHEAPQSLERGLWRVVKGVALLALPYVGGLALVGPFAFSAVFGNAWGEAGVYVLFLSPLFVLQAVASPIGGVLDILERQDLHFWREASRIALTGTALAAAVLQGLEARAGVVLLSAAGSLGYVIYVWMSVIAIRAFVATRSGRPPEHV